MRILHNVMISPVDGNEATKEGGDCNFSQLMPLNIQDMREAKKQVSIRFAAKVREWPISSHGMNSSRMKSNKKTSCSVTSSV